MGALHIERIPKPVKYLVSGVLLWIIVDFGIAGGFRVSYFEKYGLSLLLFYAGYPIIFTLFIFKLKLKKHKKAIAILSVVELGVMYLTIFGGLS